MWTDLLSLTILLQHEIGPADVHTQLDLPAMPQGSVHELADTTIHLFARPTSADGRGQLIPFPLTYTLLWPSEVESIYAASSLPASDLQLVLQGRLKRLLTFQLQFVKQVT